MFSLGEPYREAQEQDFIKVFKELDPVVPLVCVCGNHDVGNTPTPKAIQNFRDKFGDDYFTFYCGGVMFIVLNSQYFEDPSLVIMCCFSLVFKVFVINCVIHL